MTANKHTSVTYLFLSILLPFVGYVCITAFEYHTLFRYQSFNPETEISEGDLYSQCDHLFEAKSSLKPDLDFTIRPNKQNRMLYASVNSSSDTGCFMPTTNNLFWINTSGLLPDYYRYLHRFALFEEITFQG